MKTLIFLFLGMGSILAQTQGPLNVTGTGTISSPVSGSTFATANGLYQGTKIVAVTGDATGTGTLTASTGTATTNITVTKINGTALSGLATGILKNTTSTGVPSIATAGTDYAPPLTVQTGTLVAGTATFTVPNGCHPWVQATGATLTNAGFLDVTVSSTTATVNSSNNLDARPINLFNAGSQ